MPNNWLLSTNKCWWLRKSKTHLPSHLLIGLYNKVNVPWRNFICWLVLSQLDNTHPEDGGGPWALCWSHSYTCISQENVWFVSHLLWDIQHVINVHSEAAENGSSSWVPAIWVGNLDWFPGSWVWLSPDYIWGIWEIHLGNESVNICLLNEII